MSPDEYFIVIYKFKLPINYFFQTNNSIQFDMHSRATKTHTLNKRNKQWSSKIPIQICMTLRWQQFWNEIKKTKT